MEGEGEFSIFFFFLTLSERDYGQFYGIELAMGINN